MSLIVFNSAGQLGGTDVSQHCMTTFHNATSCNGYRDSAHPLNTPCGWDEDMSQCTNACALQDPANSKLCTDPTVAAKLALLAGLVNLLMGLFKLGFIVDFISYPVISGFCSAAATTIAMGQVHHLFGISAERPFVLDVGDIARNLPHSQWPDVLMSVFCISLTVAFQRLKAAKEKGTARTDRVLWFIAACGNFMVILFGTIIGLIVAHSTDFEHVGPYHKGNSSGFDGRCNSHNSTQHSCLTLTGNIKQGIPPYIAPHISGSDITSLLPGIIIVALIGYLESIAIAKAFARSNGYEVDPSQELVAIGSSNIVSSFVQAYPGTGSFSRTAVQSSTGSRTPGTGLVTAIIVLFALQFITAAMAYIPSAALSSIIIVAVLKMFNWKIVVKMWKVSKIDIIPWACSFFLCVFQSIEVGVGTGMAVNLLIMLFHTTRPQHQVLVKDTETQVFRAVEQGLDEPDPSVTVVRLGGNVYYPSGGTTKDFVMKQVVKGETATMVIDMLSCPVLDFSGVQSILELVDDLQSVDVRAFFCNLSRENTRMLDAAGLWESAGDGAVRCDTLAEATEAATEAATTRLPQSIHQGDRVAPKHRVSTLLDAKMSGIGTQRSTPLAPITDALGSINDDAE